MPDKMLYECPCCRKLVPASHFRRGAVTEDDLTIILSHPRFEKRILALLGEWAAQQPRPEVFKNKGTQRVKTAPPGFMTYREVADKYGYSIGSIRTFLSKGTLKGGGGVVRIDSIIEHKRKYVPRRTARGARKMAKGPGDISNADAALALGVSAKKLQNMKFLGFIQAGTAWATVNKESLEQYIKNNP